VPTACRIVASPYAAAATSTSADQSIPRP
jgi:hypothetical protein